MIARTHDLAAIIGLVAVVIVVSPLPPLSLATILASLLANQLGGIAPDIDQPTAPLWRNLPIGGLFGKVVGRMLGGHRFLTHSLLGLWLVGFLFHSLLLFLQPVLHNIEIEYVWWAFIIGMVSHLIMDSFTKEGVPWLLPIPVKFGFPPVRKLRLTTGKIAEKYIVFPLLVVILVSICSLYYPDLVEILRQRITE
jgi:inner membrane protein